jgi:hypothetical protein
MKYGIIFWANSSDSKKVFTLQKKRLMMDVKSHNSYGDLLKRPETLTLPCEYIFSLINFITITKNIFRPMLMYTVLTQGISTISINQLLTCHAFRKEHIMLESTFSIICHLISNGF